MGWGEIKQSVFRLQANEVMAKQVTGKYLLYKDHVSDHKCQSGEKGTQEDALQRLPLRPHSSKTR